MNPYMPPIGYEYKTIEETCELFKVNKMTIYRWIKEGAIASIKIGGTQRIIFKQDDDYTEIARASQ